MQPAPDIAPAPWRLAGHGTLLLLRCTRAFCDACTRDYPGLEGRALGGLGALMLIDYTRSNVGPYRELLLSPGLFQFGTRRAHAITHIWVSTERSVHNGRHNWGLPKKLAVFETLESNATQHRVSIRQDDAPALELTFTRGGVHLPVTTGLLPRRWRTLVQPWQNQRYETLIRARGRARLTHLRHCDNPAGSGFPDFAQQRILPGLAASRFELEFPAARITALDK